MKARDAIDLSGITYKVDTQPSSPASPRTYDCTATCDTCGAGAYVQNHWVESSARSHAAWSLMSGCNCDRVKVPKPLFNADNLHKIQQYRAEDLAACDGGEVKPGKAVYLSTKPGAYGERFAEKLMEGTSSDLVGPDQYSTTCGTCGGSGRFELFTSVERCEDCNGTGKS